MKSLAAALIAVSIIACAAIALQASRHAPKPKLQKTMGAAKTVKKPKQ